MSLKETPEVADNIIKFDGESGNAAVLNYSVPLPGKVRGRRILEITDIAQDEDWLEPAVLMSDAKALVNLEQQVGLTPSSEAGTYIFDPEAARQLYVKLLSLNGIRGDAITAFAKQSFSSTTSLPSFSTQEEMLMEEQAFVPLPEEPEGVGTLDLHVQVLRDGLQRFFDDLRRGRLGTTPAPDPDGNPLPPRLPMPPERFPSPPLPGSGEGSTEPGEGTSSTPPEQKKTTPALLLIEEYALSSFLGDYGLGRTVRTFTLLPGEEVTIRLRTWRSSEETIEESSSIFDSYSTDASDKFNESVKFETTDKATRMQKSEQHADAQARAWWGWGSASVSGGVSGESHSEREQFTRSVNDAAQEHARVATSKRDTTVTSSTETTTKAEDEETTERIIHNVNLRRTLNFVFRELNQEFRTVVHLTNIKIAYSDGLVSNYREVPISGLRTLLQEVLRPEMVDEAASRILGHVAVMFDEYDEPVNILETMTMQPDGQSWVQDDATIEIVDDQLICPPPRRDFVYRFKRALRDRPDEDTGPFWVPGIVLKTDTVVLRTDSVVVEALLGQADALDEYAMLSQKADAEAKALANVRTAIVNEGLQDIQNGEKRLEAFASIIRQENILRLDVDNKG